MDDYPLLKEYIQAILFAEDNFNELTHLRPVLDENGDPVMSSGGFAVVFKMKDEQTGKLHAVKCFLKEQEGRAEAYQMIAEELEYVNSTFLTPIKYLDKELFVDTGQTTETEFPVLLMDWVDGITLDKYIREHIDDQHDLSLLAYQFSRLAMWLMPQPFAHGDLKPDNILVKDDGTLVLVDYDGMYVPAMKGQTAREIGSPDFRHPSRTENDFDEHIDDFSLISILLSLKAISLQPELLEQYGAKDRLLFSEGDYRNLSESQTMDAIKALMSDSELATLYSLFILSASQNNLSQVSFRLLNLSRPQEPEYENLSTDVTEEDLANAWVDEYGVKYSADRKRLLKVPYNLTEYTIRKGTKVICDKAFYSNIIESGYHNQINKIIIPNSVFSIGKQAFFECFDLSSIYIPQNVNHIGAGAFNCCYTLNSIVVDVANKHYDSRNNCNAIIETKTDVLIYGCSSSIIPIGVKYIGDSAFYGRRNLNSIKIPNSVTSIGKNAFSITDLSSIVIPDSVKDIGESAFFYCNKLESVILSNSLSRIREETFAGCEKLQSIVIPNNIKNIDSSVFSDCRGLESILLPETVMSIGGGAFSGCAKLNSFNIPQHITTISYSTFEGCSSLKSIIIPESVTKIDNDAFRGCGSLKTIVIPKDVVSIGIGAFSWCNNLTSIIVDKSNVKYDSRNNCNAIIKSETDTLIAGCSSTVIPKTVETIGYSAFEGCTKMESIFLPNGISTIGNNAFRDCMRLTSIIIPDSVTSLGYCAFGGCDKLERISFTGCITSVGSSIFRDCESLKCISIPFGSYEKFEDLLPEYQDLLPEETLSTEVTDEDLVNAWTDEFGAKYSKDRKRLVKCDNPTIKEYTIKSGSIVICDCAFSCCNSLSEIHIPDSVTEIGHIAFSGCSSLSGIHIPNSVTKIGHWTFNCCSSLSEIHIPNSVTKIGDYAFRSCSSLTKIYIPDSVTSIGDGAFLFCNSLLQINIPSSVNHIGSHVFDNCDSLSQIIIPFGTLEKYTEILPFPPKIYIETFDDSFLFYTKGAYLLGRKYFEGLEVEIDYNKAIDWFNRAITSGCSSAYPYLATCYRQGLGVEKNEKIADCYFEKAGEIDFLDIVHFFYEISNYEYCLLLLKIWRTKLEDEGFQNSYGNMRRGHRRYTFYKERLTEKGYKID